MSIILTTQPNLTDEKTLNILGDFGDAIGIPGFPLPNKDGGGKNIMKTIQSDLNNVIDKLTGRSKQENFEPSFVGDGRQMVVGGSIQGGREQPLEEANVRQIYSQTPQLSVIIKKRAFSGLQHLYDTSLMDPAEQWLLRSIKRLTASKCEAMAMYERLTKIQRLEELGAKPGLILANIISTFGEQSGDVNFFTSAMQLQKAQADRQAPEVTTYFIDDSLPIVEELGPGNGIFEITSVITLNSNINLSGTGGCSFDIEDPYKIIIVTEYDIEMAIRESSISRFVDVVSSAAGLSLSEAQSRDSLLQKSRKKRNRSDITFSVGVGSNSGANAVIDAIGFEINADNLNEVPELYSLNEEEQILFKSVLSNLQNYSYAMNKGLLNGLGTSTSKYIKEQSKYVREKMRLYHMGKAIIQPMDAVHIYIDGGTRKLGETGDVDDQEKFNLTNVSGALNVAGNILGLQNEVQVDNDLLEIEWRQEGQHMKFADFKKLRTLQTSGEGGMHVFAGLVKTVTDKFSNGFFSLSVSCESNMEWLRISRYNQSPSLSQIQGIIYDPLTPFNIETDPGTGLPIGRPKLLDINEEILKGGKDKPKIYFATGPNIGKQCQTEKDMAQDARQVGGNLVTLYQHAPGLVYRWKPGIMTATYNLATTDPKDGSVVTYRQLRREIGFFSSNSPFDNIDPANIISLLVTGFPYDAVRFVQSALQTGAFTVDSTYNDYRHFFHTFLDVQRSINFVQGGFSPFKTLTVNPETMANTIRLQQQLTQKSSKLQQLMKQKAAAEDNYMLLSMAKDKRVSQGVQGKIGLLSKEIDNLVKDISGLEDTGSQTLKGSNLYIAGNNITYDLLGGEKNSKLFGDRLIHAALRRRENVVRGEDSNFLIISDEYDKDYDIQAFVLGLQSQSSELWKGAWEDVFTICNRVAEILNFEFFMDTQGHIVFRAPQYNRTPATVLNSLFSMEQTSGLNILPDFLKKLFLSREESIKREIVSLEWEIILNGALLGFSSQEPIEQFISGKTGNNEVFIMRRVASIEQLASRDSAKIPLEKNELLKIVKRSNKDLQLGGGIKGGVFNAQAQKNLQEGIQNNFRATTNVENIISFNSSDTESKKLYDDARNQLVMLRGTKKSTVAEFDDAKINVSRNGQRTPYSDISRIVANISDLVSRRSKLLLLLEKVLGQNIQIAGMGNSGSIKFSPQGLINTNFKQSESLYNQLIEDDTKNVLGHMSGERFIVKDEHIISATFEEKPPDMTSVSVMGTEPLVGESGGNLGGVPVYAAFGTDFDLWRQYGWRGEKTFEKPFLWSAELQCAPYAVMLLSRQRKNIVTGTITVMGNEYYQLGDVIYITHRNMLYYVDSIQHSFSYSGGFNTTLGLKYGRTPGEYIPTPLDVIGKGLVTVGESHNSYRMRRDIPPEDDILAVIEFSQNSSSLLKGSKAKRNFEELKRASSTAKTDIDVRNIDKSSKIFIISFGGDPNLQATRRKAIESWFNSPSSPEKGGDGISGTLTGKNITQAPPIEKEIAQYQIDKKFIYDTKETHIRQTEDYKNLTPSEIELLKSGIVASQKTINMDRSLKNVIEIRLRQAPTIGWKK